MPKYRAEHNSIAIISHLMKEVSEMNGKGYSIEV